MQQAALILHLNTPSEAIPGVMQMATGARISAYQVVVVRNGCQYAYYR